jgi:hypothetical protein
MSEPPEDREGPGQSQNPIFERQEQRLPLDHDLES